MASAAYRDGGVILITWDEGAGGDHPIGLIAVSPLAKPGYAERRPLPRTRRRCGRSRRFSG